MNMSCRTHCVLKSCQRSASLASPDSMQRRLSSTLHRTFAQKRPLWLFGRVPLQRLAQGSFNSHPPLSAVINSARNGTVAMLSAAAPRSHSCPSSVLSSARASPLQSLAQTLPTAQYLYAAPSLPRLGITHRLASSLSSALLSRPDRSRTFSSTAATMVATKLDGTAIAKSIRERLAVEIAEKQVLNPRYKPNLKILQSK